MPGPAATRAGGFTLLEVTFATGITFLAFAALLGSFTSIAFVREVSERRQHAALCLEHCLEQAKALSAVELIAHQPEAPPGLTGKYVIQIQYLDSAGMPTQIPPVPAVSPLMARMTVTTHTTRGHPIVASAAFAAEPSI